MSQLLVILALACLALGIRADYRGDGDQHRIFWPPFTFYLGPGFHWSMGALILAFLGFVIR